MTRRINTYILASVLSLTTHTLYSHSIEGTEPSAGASKKKLPEDKTAVSSASGMQKVDTILKENADCSNPIFINDSILFSSVSPKGYGSKAEIESKRPDDTLHFETEHNTVWYKFIAPVTGALTFNILPVAVSDDYDFILFRYNEKDFASKLASQAIKPLRTCISRNDKKLNSTTGLSGNESCPKYIHSGPGASYVKYVRVKKGDVFYLLLDNVKNHGDGHYIYLHYKAFVSGELYAGMLLPFNNIKFKDSDYKFKPESKKALDSLYAFLKNHPKLQIEIQGHVNRTVGSIRNYSESELSYKRAEEIRNFLVSKGIEYEQITCMGYGSKRMINPNAKTPKECYVNMRAEIYITSLDYINDPATVALSE